LRDIFNSCVQKLVSEARDKGIEVRKMIVRLTSENLDSDLHVHIQQINSDASESLLHRLMILEQSNKAKGRNSLLGAPFRIDATTLSSSSTPKKRGQTSSTTTTATSASPKRKRRKGGAGRKRRRFRPVQITINRRGLHEINNKDSYCLFRAIELLRVKARESKHTFSRYLRNARRQTDGVKTIMRALNVDNCPEGYEIETYGPLIQQHYNRLYPGQFKIFAFDAENPLKPYFSTQVATYKTPLCILFSEDHFDSIKCLNTLLGVRSYCLSCETPYNKMADHDMKCLARCKNCGRVKPSGPCPSDGTPRTECVGCSKIFTNAYDKM